jgi:glutamyl-Q tRNA(Asp) synthetase
MASPSYIGRFAPSPTGALHFGSLVTALASYLDAKVHAGKWLVRMEDVDTNRTRPGAADEILRALELFGLNWDGPVFVQSERTRDYRQAFDSLSSIGLIYPCACSRRMSVGRYTGVCTNGLAPGQHPRSYRVRVSEATVIKLLDLVQESYSQNVNEAVGDFIVLRADGLFAYQLAVVVDDAAQQVTHVVRGSDLLDNTPRQIYLQKALGYPTPQYAHIPVAVDHWGQKLSKSTGAAALSLATPHVELQRALAFLGHKIPTDLNGASVDVLLRWAINAWSLERVPKTLVQRMDCLGI